MPSNPSGLERRILVFNSDFMEKNFQWSLGKASPVFIGAPQVEAAKELEECEKKIGELESQCAQAERDHEQAKKQFANFKRDHASQIAQKLRLNGGKYEANHFSKDCEKTADELPRLSDEELLAAEALRRASEPKSLIKELKFDTSRALKAFWFIQDMCTQTLSKVALDEIEEFPEMLLWTKQGHEFHKEHDLDHCLLCGSDFSAERRILLTTALDDKIDKFVDKLNKASKRLKDLLQSLEDISKEVPQSDLVEANLVAELKEKREKLSAAIEPVKTQLKTLSISLDEKLKRPASPADLSQLPAISVVEQTSQALAVALDELNKVVEQHNKEVSEFTERQQQAELAIRKHYTGQFKPNFTHLQKKRDDALKGLDDLKRSLEAETTKAGRLRGIIRTHGPAAEVINKLVRSYLGHDELTIRPVEEGYEIQRHRTVIEGLPSEGEKTAIGIAYFLSMVESDGRKLKDMIVVIDDPVSSLDTKALNFACGLIKNRLEGASQIIVLTHNQQCMNEFKKAWRGKARPKSDKTDPTATFLFIDVSTPKGSVKRCASLVPMSKLLREYDSEYHFLFSYVLRFINEAGDHSEIGYMMPNVLRKVLEIFLAFKCPGSSGLIGKIGQLCKDHSELDPHQMRALERLSQVESHADNLDDLTTFSSMNIEECRDAASALLEMMKHVDDKHLQALKRLCNGENDSAPHGPTS